MKSTGADNPDVVGYRRLIAWRKAHELALKVYKATRGIPREDYWLRQQICRAAFSVPSNIVEGYSRRSRREYVQFLNIARASLAEVEYQLFFMAEAGLADADSFAEIDRLRSEAAGLLYKLIRSLENRGDSNGQFIGEDQAEYLPGTDSDWYEPSEDDLSLPANQAASDHDPLTH